jgi:hypothetical protein
MASRERGSQKRCKLAKVPDPASIHTDVPDDHERTRYPLAAPPGPAWLPSQPSTVKVSTTPYPEAASGWAPRRARPLLSWALSAGAEAGAGSHDTTLTSPSSAPKSRLPTLRNHSTSPEE